MPGPISTVSNNTPLILGFGLAVGAVAVGVWGAKGMRGLNGSRRRGLGGQRTVRRPSLRGHAEQSELQLFIENDGQLYRGQTTSIIKNLATKMAKGVPFLEARERNHFLRVEPEEWSLALEALDAGRPT